MPASFIHLGFSPGPAKANTLYLLASSMADSAAFNGVVEDYSQIHRLSHAAEHDPSRAVHRKSLYATELGACCLAHLAPAISPYGEGINEMADSYSLWGCGVPGAGVRYRGPE